MKGNQENFRNDAIVFFLADLILLEPLNLFLYTWRYLHQLELEETNPLMKRLYHWFSLISILLLPLCYYTLVPACLIELSSCYFQINFNNTKGNDCKVSNGLLKAVVYLGLVTNIVSCTILGLVLRLLRKIANSVIFGRETVERKRRVSKTVTAGHICFTLAFSISQALTLFTHKQT